MVIFGTVRKKAWAYPGAQHRLCHMHPAVQFGRTPAAHQTPPCPTSQGSQEMMFAQWLVDKLANSPSQNLSASPMLSGGHKGCQQHPSLAQLLLEGLFIFFSWLLGHKEESQAKQTSPCWAHYISIPLQVYRLWIFPWPRQHQPPSLSQEQFGAQAPHIFICKTLGLQNRITTYTSTCTRVLRLQMSKYKASKQQRGPERSLLCFLPATADIPTALLDYVKALETGAKDGAFHGTDFLMRSPAGLWIGKLRENSQQQTWASLAVLLRNLSPRDVQDRH